MIRDTVVIETDSLRLVAEDGCVVLYSKIETETRLILSPGEARSLAKMIEWFSAGLASNLRMAARSAVGTEPANSEHMSDE